MNRVLSLWVVAVAVFFGGLRSLSAAETSSSSSSATSGGKACVSEQATKTLKACPDNGPTSFNVSAHGKAPHDVLPLERCRRRSKKGDKKIEVGHADVSMIAGMRDERQTGSQAARPRRCSSRRSSSSSASSSRPRQRRRTGRCSFGGSRKTTSSSRTRPSARRPRRRSKRDELKTSNPREAGRQQAIANSRKTTIDRARKAAINYYSTLVGDYAGAPSDTFPKNPPPAYAQLDEVYYYLAYEYEQSGDTSNARRVYLELITKTPKSKYIPNAYLAFGELFFNEARATRRKWDLGRAGVPEGHQVTAAGQQGVRLRLVQARLRLLEPGRLRRTRSTRSRRRSTTARSSRQLPNAAKLAESARDATSSRSTPSRAVPSDAYNFFKNLSGDAAGVERQDVQDDGRPGPELPGHRVTIPRRSRSTRT